VITAEELFYLEDKELARQVAEHGYQMHKNNAGDVLTRAQFEEKKKALREKRANKTQQQNKALAHEGTDYKSSPFLTALAEREESIRNGKKTTILFLRIEEVSDVKEKQEAIKKQEEDQKKKFNEELKVDEKLLKKIKMPKEVKQLPKKAKKKGIIEKQKKREISGYIDLAHRMQTENFRDYFTGKLKLKPRPSDLSYYNWETQKATANESPNFRVDTDSKAGLLFRNRRDRKTICVDPQAYIGTNLDPHTTRVEIQDLNEYAQIVFFDHEATKKS
jgi:hypothetical protein